MKHNKKDMPHDLYYLLNSTSVEKEDLVMLVYLQKLVFYTKI